MPPFLADACDILLFQKATGTEHDLVEFPDWVHDWRFLGSFAPDGTASGVALDISPRMRTMYSDLALVRAVARSMALLRLRGIGVLPLDIDNVILVSGGITSGAGMISRMVIFSEGGYGVCVSV